LALGTVAEAVGGTAFAAWAAGSSYAYPAANVVHLLGLVLLLGGIGLVDLRLIGAFRSLPLEPLARALTPLAVSGLGLLAVSGAVMFAADTAVADSQTFRTKLILILVVLANAAAFRFAFGRTAAPAPAAARLMGGASLLLWLAVAYQGRMIAYT
jgi:hypothetical protein